MLTNEDLIRGYERRTRESNKKIEAIPFEKAQKAFEKKRLALQNEKRTLQEMKFQAADRKNAQRRAAAETANELGPKIQQSETRLTDLIASGASDDVGIELEAKLAYMKRKETALKATAQDTAQFSKEDRDKIRNQYQKTREALAALNGAGEDYLLCIDRELDKILELYRSVDTFAETQWLNILSTGILAED